MEEHEKDFIDWCSVANAGFEYYQNAKKDGIGLPPSDVRIWVFKHKKNTSCAPMLRRVKHSIGYNSDNAFKTLFYNVFAGGLANFYKSLLNSALPDIIIGTGGGYNTYQIYETVNHELSHASHFNKVGSAYWANYINFIVTYGKKDDPYYNASGRNSGYCGIGEMWGYAMGYCRAYDKYKKKPTNGEAYWFVPNLMYEIIQDNILTKKQVFDCLSSDVTSHESLKQKMITKYPWKKDLIISKYKEYGF